MNRYTFRTSAGLAACGLAAAVALTACSAGQVSQTATQEPAVNGVNAQAGDVGLRNVHLRAAQQSDYVEPGTDVELLFVATNGTVPANGVLLVGEPDGLLEAVESIETADAVTAEVALTKPITNGLLYDFTFTFENGETTVAVPISAGNEPRRDQTGETQEAEHGGH